MVVHTKQCLSNTYLIIVRYFFQGERGIPGMPGYPGPPGPKVKVLRVYLLVADDLVCRNIVLTLTLEMMFFI